MGWGFRPRFARSASLHVPGSLRQASESPVGSKLRRVRDHESATPRRRLSRASCDGVGVARRARPPGDSEPVRTRRDTVPPAVHGLATSGSSDQSVPTDWSLAPFRPPIGSLSIEGYSGELWEVGATRLLPCSHELGVSHGRLRDSRGGANVQGVRRILHQRGESPSEPMRPGLGWWMHVTAREVPSPTRPAGRWAPS